MILSPLSRGSTGSDYILARLERDRPDVVRLVDGEVGALGEVGGDRRSDAVQVQVDNINLKTKGGTDPTIAGPWHQAVLVARVEATVGRPFL